MAGLQNAGKAFYRKHWILLNAFLFFPFILPAQFNFNNNCREAFQNILSLRFNSAAKWLESERKENPSNLLPVYFENYADFLTVFIGEEEPRFQMFKDELSKRIDLIERAEQKSPWYHYCLGNMHLQRAITRLKFGEFKSAAFDISQAYKELQENKKENPDFLPQNTALGMIHVFAGIIPENYSWILQILGIKGDVEMGLSEMAMVSDYKGHDEVYGFFKTEALLYLAITNASLGKDKRDALNIIQRFDKQNKGFPGTSNPLYIFVKASILMRSGLNDEALECLQLYRPDPVDFPFFYLDYLIGLSKLNRLDTDADRYFLKYIHNFNGKNYVKSAYQKLAWTNLLKGNDSKYREYISLIPEHGEIYIDADRQASREAEKNEVPNVTLLKARLLFDGGYYDKALHELLDHPVKEIISSKKDLLEYYYRLARIYHESGNITKALFYYDQTIRNGSNYPYYFAANSALQEGIIYESRSDYKNAEKYYRMVLSMDFDEYKTSLGQKAKAGLKRIKMKIP